jgi:hypothetical protein
MTLTDLRDTGKLRQMTFGVHQNGALLMQDLVASQSSGKTPRRSFRFLDESAVAVTINGRTVRYTLNVRTCYDCNDNPEWVLALRCGRDVIHVRMARDGSAMCLCNEHFHANHCWHVDLAAALVRRLDENHRLLVADESGKPIAEIVSPSGLSRSHRKLAECLKAQPFLLRDARQIEAMQDSIADTRIRVL